ncbi:MAG: hypothetical protein WCW87_02955 [Candidatus Paceibacterota bacterium]
MNNKIYGMDKKILISVIISLIVVGSGSFYAGMKYDQSNQSATRGQKFQQMGGAGFNLNQKGTAHNGNNMMNGNGGFAAGEILSKDDKSITIKLTNGGSKIVFLSDSTKVTKDTEGSKNDLSNGVQVVASGSANSDGSITAQTVQIRAAQPQPQPQPQQPTAN